MRRAVLFLSRFVISLWTVLVVSFLSLLIFNAPHVPNTAPFERISIKTNNGKSIHLPSRIFNCTETKTEFSCQTNIQERLLNFNFIKGSEYKYDPKNCRAWYNNQSVDCWETGRPYRYEIANLGLSSQQVQAVMQKYWGINALIQMGESGLIQISILLSLVAGLNAVFLAWFYPRKLSKAFASLGCGFGMYRLVWGLLGRVRYDLVTPYGFTPDTWSWVVNGGAMIAGVGTLIATAFLLWGRFHHFIKIPISIITSVGIFNLCSLSIFWIFTYLLPLFGLSEALLENRYMLWILATIPSIFAIVAVRLCLHTNQSIRKFLCLGSGIGAVALAINFFLFILLGLGYVY